MIVLRLIHKLCFFFIIHTIGIFSYCSAFLRCQRRRSSPAPLARYRARCRIARTGEALIGASVLVPATQQGTATGLDGSFELRGLAPGTAVVIRAQSLDYEPQEHNVVLTVGTTQRVAFQLATSGQQFKEITVAGQADRESASTARRTEQKAYNVLSIIAARTNELSPDVLVNLIAGKLTRPVRAASGMSP